MKQITLRLPTDEIDALDDEAEEAGVSRSEYIRQVLADRHDTGEADELRDRVDDLETEVERLRREKRQILDQREEKRELARYAEEQRTREQQREEASLPTRAKWWLFGRDVDNGDE